MVYYILTRPDTGDPYSPCGDGGDVIRFMFECEPSDLSYDLLLNKFKMWGTPWVNADNIETMMDTDYEVLSQPQMQERFSV